ncbi:hypothetical protein [Aliiroseovarius sediminis]|uniref:hypothetical protein n=1 Tax=Aliiroseovarius sediminis TaxID=2925839 RepID=UPI001F5AFED3|nr:hypothetical protein [Aliiroseovarius sediminis]MCI2395979.1 hypothetical protein [Aliiroseovarius sediminis]
MPEPTMQNIHHVLGPLTLEQLHAIQNSGASLEDIRQAKAIADGTDDIVGTGERSLPGAVQQILTILSGSSHD